MIGVLYSGVWFDGDAESAESVERWRWSKYFTVSQVCLTLGALFRSRALSRRSRHQSAPVIFIHIGEAVPQIKGLGEVGANGRLR